MSHRIRRTLLLLLVAGSALWAAGRAWGIGFILGETKEELKLDYSVDVADHGTGRVTVVLTLISAGRLDPLDEVQLVIPGEELNANGGHWMDLVVSIDMRDAGDGRRVGGVHILRTLAERAQIQLNTHTLDGQIDPLTRLHHVIPIAEYLDDVAAQPTEPPPADESRQDAPPAAERGE